MKKVFAAIVFLSLMGTGESEAPPPKDSEFVFARVEFTQRRWTQYWEGSAGPPWWHDWPFSDEFVTSLVQELTGVRTTTDSHVNVELESPDIFKYPFLYISEPGFMSLNDREIANLGQYIRRGGFIMADDFREPGFLIGDDEVELEVLRYYLSKAVPEYKLVRLDVSHPIFHQFFDIETLDMDPPYFDFKPEFWGLVDEHGKLRLIANYNNDLGDYWEDLDKGGAPVKPAVWATQLGVNYVLYAMSH